MVGMSHVTTEPILTVTDAARDKILEVREGEPDAASLALWVEIQGEAAGAYTYSMDLRPVEDAGQDDVVQHDDLLSVVIDGASAERLVGATLDLSAGAGMVMQNPNHPEPPAAAPAADLSGPLAQQALALLEQEINPQIAAHGGRADLVAVEDGSVYLRLSGGCQGCGQAAATLKQGIEVAIRDAMPEIQRVVDVTDHAAGTNPYFQPA